MYLLYDTKTFRKNAIILHVEEDRIILNEKEYRLEDIKKRTDFRPYCKIGFPIKQTAIDQRVIEDSFGGKHSYPYAFPPFDIFTITSETKLMQHEIENLINYHLDVAFIFFPHTKNFKDAVLTIIKSGDENVPLIVTTLDADKNKIDYVPDQILTESARNGLCFPKCKLAVIDNGTKSFNRLPVYVVEFTYNDMDGNFVECDFDAYVKTSCGYVSHRKLKVKNGKATFKYIPIGVNDDEKAEIQVGIGKFSVVTGILEI
jgi:hypothetical protein